MIVRRTRTDLLKLLSKSDVPHYRWEIVTLAVVIDMAGQTLQLYEQGRAIAAEGEAVAT